jgi:pilus assembly protein CpaE
MDQTLSITAIVRTKESAENVRSVSDNFDTELKLQTGEFSQFAPALRAGKAPDILIVELSLEKDNEVELLSQIIELRGAQTAVIATAKSADLGGIRSLMRIGVADFLPQPFTKVDLFGAIESATNTLKLGGRRGGKTGKVLSFIRSCGGAGSTTLATQTALELIGQGKAETTVALVDFDLQFGSVGLALDVPDKGGLPLILEAPSRLDRSLLRASMVEHQSGVHVLTAPDTIVPLTALTPEAVNRTISLARTEYDYVICDLPHAWTNWTASAIRGSDQIMLVTELSVPALQRTRRILDLLAEQGLGEIPINILANKFESGWGTGGHRKRAEEALGRNFDFIIRSDTKTACEARDRGVPLRQLRSRSVIVKDVTAMIGALKKSFEDSEKAADAEKA